MHYFFRRAGWFYFRIAVPQELRHRIGKREIRRTLNTTNRRVGALRALQVAVAMHAEFEKMSEKTKEPAVMRHLTTLFADGSVRLEEPYSERELADFIRITKELRGSAAPEQATKTFPEIWNLYSAQRKAEDGWSPKTLHEMHTPVERYQRYCDDNKLDPFLQSTAAGYPNALLAQKTRRGTTLSVATANQHLERIGAMLRWAVDRGYAPADHFAKLKIKIGARAKAAKGKPRQPYTHAEVEHLFKVLDPATDARHWAVLIGLYTGCRINEVAQLYTDDVQEETGVPFIHIREGRADQRVKGHKSRRVPIHPALIKRGFLTWVEGGGATEAGQERLFAEFTYGRDGYGQSCSKWFNRTFREAHGIAKDFHSLRHYVPFLTMSGEVGGSAILIVPRIATGGGTAKHPT